MLEGLPPRRPTLYVWNETGSASALQLCFRFHVNLVLFYFFVFFCTSAIAPSVITVLIKLAANRRQINVVRRNGAYASNYTFAVPKQL